MDRVERLITAVRTEHAPDSRTAVFDIHAESRAGTIVFFGETTEPAAVDALIRRTRAELGDAAPTDEVVRLPDETLGADRFAVIRSAIAPVHAWPRISSVQISQYVLGQRVDLLSRRNAWWRVRGGDGYIGWIHAGFLETGTRDWARRWEDGEAGDEVVSLGAELVDADDRVFTPLPWGARLFRHSARLFRLADGRTGGIGAGEIVALDRRRDRFPARGDSIVRTARRWMGTPYLWGGISRAGADCSGFVQSVYWMHGVALPRDADQQAEIGAEVGIADDFSDIRPGDLLFFAEHASRITHVAIAAGGPRIIHSALANGAVRENELTGDHGLERGLRRILVGARRVLGR